MSNRPGRPTKNVRQKQWCEEFIQLVLDNPFNTSLADELNKKLRQEYTRGYQSAKRPFKYIKCTWCGLNMEGEGTIHKGCAEIKRRLHEAN